MVRRCKRYKGKGFYSYTKEWLHPESSQGLSTQNNNCQSWFSFFSSPTFPSSSFFSKQSLMEIWKVELLPQTHEKAIKEGDGNFPKVACVVRRAILKSWSPWHHNAASGCACLKPITSIYSSIPLFPLACEGKCQFTACFKKSGFLVLRAESLILEFMVSSNALKQTNRANILQGHVILLMGSKYLWALSIFENTLHSLSALSSSFIDMVPGL